MLYHGGSNHRRQRNQTPDGKIDARRYDDHRHANGDDGDHHNPLYNGEEIGRFKEIRPKSFAWHDYLKGVESGVVLLDLLQYEPLGSVPTGNNSSEPTTLSDKPIQHIAQVSGSTHNQPDIFSIRRNYTSIHVLRHRSRRRVFRTYDEDNSFGWKLIKHNLSELPFSRNALSRLPIQGQHAKQDAEPYESEHHAIFTQSEI